jgi:hypothetical protein
MTRLNGASRKPRHRLTRGSTIFPGSSDPIPDEGPAFGGNVLRESFAQDQETLCNELLNLRVRENQHRWSWH